MAEVTLSALNAPPDGDVDIDGSGDQNTLKKLEFDSGVVSPMFNVYDFVINYLKILVSFGAFSFQFVATFTFVFHFHFL